MSRFVLKNTTDGTCHLYFDNPSIEGFLKVSQATNAKFLRENNENYVVMSNAGETTKILFGIIDDRVFQVTLPEHSKFFFVDNQCIYERYGVWYSMVHEQDSFEEKKLGIAHEEFLSCPQNIQYRKLRWVYFLKEDQNLVNICHFIDGKIVNLGSYVSVKTDGNAKILALHSDGHYDVFTPNSTEPYLGDPNEVFEAIKGVFIWCSEQKKWRFEENCRLYADNALFRIVPYEDGDMLKLYRITENSTELFKASVNYQFRNNPCSLCIDDTIYMHDVDKCLLDFDNPQLTFRRKLKNFFCKK
jgi:hypothetical protein